MLVGRRGLELIGCFPRGPAQIKVSFFALADQARMVFKAETGLGMAEAPRDVSFCPWNFLNFVPQVTTIPDADIDARFTTNPLVSTCRDRPPPPPPSPPFPR